MSIFLFDSQVYGTHTYLIQGIINIWSKYSGIAKEEEKKKVKKKSKEKSRLKKARKR